MALHESRVEAVIAVSDLEQARAFYADALGLGPGEVEEGGVRWTCGEGTCVFVYRSPDHAVTSGATVAGWFVDDLDAEMRAMADRGVAFERYDGPGVTTDEHGVFDAGRFRAAWARDPDGNTLAFTEMRG
jgi:catechol 2,3-dioxygenase-like lactoylglutathione lyase family enzyme